MSDAAQWIAFLTLIAGFVWQWVRENRQRQWDKEDRAEVATQRLAVAAALAAKVDDTAKLVAVKMVAATDRVTALIDGHGESLAKQIDANTDISTKAFYEANQSNLKIEKLGLEHNQLQKERQDEKHQP